MANAVNVLPTTAIMEKVCPAAFSLRRRKPPTTAAWKHWPVTGDCCDIGIKTAPAHDAQGLLLFGKNLL